MKIKNQIDYLSIALITLLCICSVFGVLSIDFTKSFDVVNQYCHTVKVYGNGIYAADSYFKASIAIGTDFCILFVLVPLLIISYIKRASNNSVVNKLNLMSLYAVAIYYAASISFGIKYNQLHLIYIALFSCSLFGLFKLLCDIDISKLSFTPTKGLNVFLVVCGIGLIVAWLPDIIPTIFSGGPITLIEVYTTEITYVLDMGIIAPLCLICCYLLNKKAHLGSVILAIILKISLIVGIMMIPQTVCLSLAGVDLPLPAIITKSAIFIALGVFAFMFERKLYTRLRKIF